MAHTIFICRFKQSRPKDFVYLYSRTDDLTAEFIDIHCDVINGKAGSRIFSFLTSQQKGKTISSLRPLRLCGELLAKIDFKRTVLGQAQVHLGRHGAFTEAGQYFP